MKMWEALIFENLPSHYDQQHVRSLLVGNYHQNGKSDEQKFQSKTFFTFSIERFIVRSKLHQIAWIYVELQHFPRFRFPKLQNHHRAQFQFW